MASLKVTSNGNYALINITSPKETKRTPSEVVCVIDVSGSMSASATLKSDTGKTEDTGLTVLDIVKHAVKTVIHSLEDDDHLSIVAFDNKAVTPYELNNMNKKNKDEAQKALNSLRPGASTNLWAGIELGLDVLRLSKKSNERKSVKKVLVFTDGEPTDIPKDGHIVSLQNYRDKYKVLPATVSTFAFGYTLDSPLLLDIAMEGNGVYAFIPDASFVGTTFCHTLAQIVTTYADNLEVSIEPEDGVEIKEVLGVYPKNTASWGVMVRPGDLNFGQSKNIVVEFKAPHKPLLNATIKMREVSTGKEIKITSEDSEGPKGPIEKHVARLNFIKSTFSAMTLADSLWPKRTKEALGKWRDEIKASEGKLPINSIQTLVTLIKSFTEFAKYDKKFYEDLLKDIEGQVTEALQTKEAYEKWGRHYLPSLLLAHLMEQCNNFKDPGVQHYIGDAAIAVRDVVDEVFLKLPAPKPSNPAKGSAPVNMSRYYSSSAPCFAGKSLVKLQDGSDRKSVV